jgi:hypothetical protein
MTSCGDSAILGTTETSPKLTKPSSRASSCRSARISRINALLSKRAASPSAWSEARVTYARYSTRRRALLRANCMTGR